MIKKQGKLLVVTLTTMATNLLKGNYSWKVAGLSKAPPVNLFTTLQCTGLEKTFKVQLSKWYYNFNIKNKHNEHTDKQCYFMKY